MKWDANDVQMNPNEPPQNFPVQVATPLTGFVAEDATEAAEAAGTWISMSLNALETLVTTTGGELANVHSFTDPRTAHGVVLRKCIYVGFLLVEKYLQQILSQWNSRKGAVRFAKLLVYLPAWRLCAKL